jgi:hypothetical protein
MRSRRPTFVLLLFGVGCVNEFHPEYHPQSSVTYVQNNNYATVVMGEPSEQRVSPEHRKDSNERAEAKRPKSVSPQAPEAPEILIGQAAPPLADRANTALPLEPAPRASPDGIAWLAASEPKGEDPGSPTMASLPYVETRIPMADALELKRAKYARFEVRLAADPESESKKLYPIDRWGGSRFDVRRDPTNPNLAVVRFDVWAQKNLQPNAALVVATTTRAAGDVQEESWVSYGELGGVRGGR